MNIPQVYREKIASSVVGTPGVDTSGQAIGEAVAQPAFELAEKQQAMKDEASYYASMLQHKQNMDSALEDIKIKYANNPDGAGPAMMQAIKDSQRVVTEAAPNPRVKLMVARGEPGVETWNMKMAYQWSSDQTYRNLVHKSTGIMDDMGHKSFALGTNLDMAPQEMFNQLGHVLEPVSSLIGELKASKHPELGDEVELKTKHVGALSLLDGTLQTQPWKAAKLMENSEFTKLLPETEMNTYKHKILAALHDYPRQELENKVFQSLNANAGLTNSAMTGKATEADVETARRKGDIDDLSAKFLSEVAANRRVVAQNENRNETRSNLFDSAIALGDKFLKGNADLTEKTPEGKVELSKNIKELDQFRNNILDAKTKGLLSDEETQQYLNHLYYPLSANVLFHHNQSLWQTYMQTFKTHGILTPEMSNRVTEFQTASKIINENLIRNNITKDFETKARFYDSYFRAADKYLKPGVLNLRTNAPYTATDVAHAVVGQGIGDYISTPLGLKKIEGYDSKTKSPLFNMTPEEEDKLAQDKILTNIKYKKENK